MHTAFLPGQKVRTRKQAATIPAGQVVEVIRPKRYQKHGRVYFRYLVRWDTAIAIASEGALEPIESNGKEPA